MMMKIILIFLFSNYISVCTDFYQRGFDFLQYGGADLYHFITQSVLTEKKEIQWSLKVII